MAIIMVLLPRLPMNYFLYLDDLPPAARLIAELLGAEKCLQLLSMYGGTRFYIPSEGFSEVHPVREILDLEECELLKKYLAGFIYLPTERTATKAARDREIWRDRELGLSIRQLSRKYELCERQIQKSVKAHVDGLRIISGSLPVEA